MIISNSPSWGLGLALTIFLIGVPPVMGNFYLHQFDDANTASEETLNFFLDQIRTTLEVNMNLTDFIKDNEAKAKVLPIDHQMLTDRVVKMVGEVPEEGKLQREGILNALLHAYHSRPVDDKEFNESSFYWQTLTMAERDCRDYQGGILLFHTSPCRTYHNVTKPTLWNSIKDDKWTFGRALAAVKNFDHNRIWYDCLGTHSKFYKATAMYKDLLPGAYNACLFALLTQMDMMADFDRIRVNHRHSQPDFPQGIFTRMMKDTEESMNYIEENIEELNQRKKEAEADTTPDKHVIAYWDGLLTKFRNTLKDDTFKQLYGENLKKDLKIINDARAALEKLKEATKDFRKYPYEEYSKDIEGFVSKMLTPEVEGRWTTMLETWKNLLQVVPHPLKDDKKLDPNWDFQLTMPLHKLRVGWDRLDNISEAIKCHLKKSYWFDLRNQTLKDTQMDLEHGRIFGHFSRTLYQTCRSTDTDIISRCNAKNHEVCRPMIPSDRQEEHNTNTGDLSMYRPKWVYWRTVTDQEGIIATCEGERTFIIPLNLCRCGFILDCARDLGVNMNCPLLPNDNLRKQCKGNIGYPCKSLPFAPGRHDASCVFAYCDMERNLCMEDPVMNPIVHSNSAREK